MELLLGFLGCIAVGVFLLLPVVALVLAVRAQGEASEARARAETLSLQLDSLRKDLSALRTGPLPAAAEPVQAAPPTPAPAPEPVSGPVAPPPPEPPPVAPVVPPEPEPEPAPAPPPAAPIEWEKWLGVRGAAVLGGIVLALAGLLFFKYSVERGWIAPPVRVGMAVIAGVGALLLGEKLRRGYATTANALAGGGVVVLYAAAWAARVLYQLIPLPAAFGLMALVTVVACLLALRHQGQLVALLGLAGGFATPLLLSTGENRPVGFFGYLLLVDAGFLFVAWRRQWRTLSGLALAGTLLLQGAWMVQRMEPTQLPLALGVLAVFTALFVAMTRALPREASPEVRREAASTHGVALLSPFAFAAYLASTATDLPSHLVPLAAFLALMGGAAAWLSRRSEELPAGVAPGAAAGQVAVMLFVVNGMALHVPSESFRLAAALLGIALPWAAALEWPRGAPVPSRLALASALSLGGLGLLGGWAWVEAAAPDTFGAAVAFVAGFTALALRRSARAGETGAQWVPAMAGALVLGVSAQVILNGGLEPAAAALALPLGTGALLLPVALAALAGARREGAAREGAFRAGALAVATVFAVASTGTNPGVHREAQFALLLLLAAGAASATPARAGRTLLALVLLGGVAQAAWANRALEHPAHGLALLVASAALAASWPLLAARALLPLGASAWISTLPWVISFPTAKALLERLGYGHALGVLPLGLACAVLGQLAWARREAPSEEARRRMGVWLAGLALMLVAVAIPLQLERQWMTIGWAVMSVALLVLWQRLDHEGLKYFAAALLALVTVRLVFNPYVLDYAERGQRVFNWLMYTYLVPAACLALSARLLGPLELPRLRDWEKRFYAATQPLLAVLAAVGFMLVVFVYLTLAVFDFYSPEGPLSVSLDRLPARDLTLSLTWLLYAAAILAVGMWKGSRGLRWASLVFMLVSIGKVFLYDLGNLTDLYRVLSLLGLAVSLFVVSLAYQRFVFRKEAP